MPPLKSSSKSSDYASFALELFTALRGKIDSVKSSLFLPDQNKTLHDTIAKLTQQNALKDRLLAIVSHDIRSPLDSLKALLCLLIDEDISQRELKQLVSSLDDQVEQLSHFLENILRWTKNDSSTLKPEFEQLNLLPLVKETVDLHRVQAERKLVHLDICISEESVVYADKEMTKVILRNLISNAVKFSNPNHSVHIHAKEHQGLVAISVQDYGLGISSETIPHLFDHDHLSTKGTRNEIGIGIGLTLCKEFAEKMGGTITATSVEGHGSCFEFTVHSPASPTTEFQKFIEKQE